MKEAGTLEPGSPFGEPIELRDAAVISYIAMVKQGADIMYLVSDSVSTSRIKPFRELFPGRLINVGIAEQNLMGIAAGLANSGIIPITGNAAPFLISRSNEQLKVDISYSNSNVKVTGLHPGFSYGTDGITHHEVNDIGVIRGMPNFEIYVPCDPRECVQMLEYAVLKRRGPVYTSLNTGKLPVITPETYTFIPGVPVRFSGGKDITIIALGSAVHDVLQAAEQLKNTLSCEIFAVTSVRPFIAGSILESIQKTGLVLTVEQHSTHGGVGSMIAELIAEQGLGVRLRRLGVPEGSFTRNRTAPDNKAFFSLDAAGIVKILREMIT
ncbi:MAG: transketolase family protein [Spirochaetaceae bacterium]|jgi:transketolase|nr:transketolase family protein [Spirochaetaceae bacterium]